MIPDFLNAARSDARLLRTRLDSHGGDFAEAGLIDVEAVVQRGLDWAFGSLGDVASLHEAHELLEGILADYYAAILHAKKSGRFPDLSKPFESHRRATNEFNRGWPTTSAAEEQSRTTDMMRGSGVGLDDAFLGISGLSREEWDRAVNARRTANQRRGQPAHG
jgi:hypothetical protein